MEADIIFTDSRKYTAGKAVKIFRDRLRLLLRTAPTTVVQRTVIKTEEYQIEIE